MSQPPPPRSKSTLSTFIGIWLGLTVVVGVGVFALLYWFLGGGQSAAPTQPAPVTAPTQAPTNAPAPTATEPPAVGGGAEKPTTCPYPLSPASGFGYGIQSHVFVGENDYWLGVITDKLHFQWVKMQVRWTDMEKTQGDIDWGIIDSAMLAACAKGLHVMLSIVDAPAWTQANPMPAPEGQAAPPDDPAQYAAFVGKIIDRYPDQIGAIEVWNEMNLEREWNTAAGVNPADYITLLQATYATIKSKDPNIIVIAGALSPTGINCNVSFPNCQPSGRPIVVDDVTYLRQFIQAGGLEYADCLGTHSNGTNLPPTADGTRPPGDGASFTFKGPWQTPHYSWSLKSQVETYATLLNGQRQQCVTEFGYASAVNGVYPPNFGFAADVSEEQQGEYLVEALNWMRDSKLVTMAFLFNLDYGPKGGDPASDDNVIFSVLNKDGSPRPAFDALSLMEKP